MLKVILLSQRMGMTKRIGGMAIQLITSILLMMMQKIGLSIGLNYYRNNMVLTDLNSMQEKVISLQQIQFFLVT
jgi:hypothetical protein